MKLKQKDTSHVNRSTTSNDIEAVIKRLSTNKSPGQDGSTATYY
jgi:hypothetical protein